jgi:cation transport ATPase
MPLYAVEGDLQVQNLWYAAGYNVVAIPLAPGVLASTGILLRVK